MTGLTEQNSAPSSLRTGRPGGDQTVGVIGGGAVGMTAAADLAAAGADVTLYEREHMEESGRRDAASLRAAGIVYDAHTTEVDALLAERSITRFESLAKTNDGFRFERCPYVIVVETEDTGRAETLRTAAERMQESNRRVKILESRQLSERFPELETDDIGLALVTENAGWTDPPSYIAVMTSRVRDSAVTIREGVQASVTADPLTITTDDRARRFDAVLVAAGAHTRQVCERAGHPIPVKPYRVQASVADQQYQGPMCFDATSEFYFRPHPDGILVGDGTEPFATDPDHWNRQADDWFRDEITDNIVDRTGHDSRILDSWAGLCTATPDGNPLVGELVTGLYVAAGWQGHGFMRAPGIAERVAACIVGLSETPESFRPTRFEGSKSFDIREGMAIDPDQ